MTNETQEPRVLFGKYTVLDQLQAGGMSQGFRVRDPDGAELFLKRVPVSGISADALRRELDIYARLQRSPATHVLTVYGQERDEDFIALVTEFADGGNLEDYASAQPDGFAPPQAKPILVEILAGLRELHDLGIVHRDLKPGNIFLVGGKWMLGDFGISKSLARLQTSGRTFQSHGTLGFAPPEQLSGAEAHSSADIFSFGKLIAFVLTGQTDVDQILWPTWAQIARRCISPVPSARPTLGEVEANIAALAVEALGEGAGHQPAPRRAPAAPPVIADTRPVSEALERDLRGRLATKPLVWLDRDAHYVNFVDRLIEARADGRFPVPVVAFRGSFLDVMLQLEELTGSIDPAPFLLHLPGFNQETVRATPLLEVYKAFADRFWTKLDTLILEAATGLVRPEDVTTWLAEGSRQLEDADKWIASRVEPGQQGLAELLDRMGIDAVFGQLSDAARGDDGVLAPQIGTDAEMEVLVGFLERHTGFSGAWRQRYWVRDEHSSGFGKLARVFLGWLLAVEYVNDLNRAPHLPLLRDVRTIPKPYAAVASRLLDKLRGADPDTYVSVADEYEQDLADELRKMAAEDLGKIDTFRAEEVKVLEGAVDLLLGGRWAEARAWCEARQGGKSFWLARDQQRAWAWSLVLEAARFGDTLEAHPDPLAGVQSHEDALARYREAGVPVDRAHRDFEQKKIAVLDSRLPHFAALQRVVGDLRKRYRVWADDLARRFATLCEERGFLPASELRQRAIFDDIVAPLLTAGGKVAVLAIDALRFEMAESLVSELKGTGIDVRLDARLAELPTLTSVGMNVIPPVTQGGRLRPVADFKGFRAAEFIVNSPTSRARAMGLRATGSTAVRLDLGDVVSDSVEKLQQRVAQASLLLVVGREIDDAGEAGVGPATFESSLRQVVSAVHQLQGAGVSSVVVTSDHGFLLQDETTHVQKFGTRRDPERRHVLADEPRREEGMIPVKLSELEYEGLDGYLLFRRDTAVFATSRAGANFVHGGNSLQERVIPVLTIRRLREGGQLHNELAIEVVRDGRVLGCERLRVRVQVAQETPLALGFMGGGLVQLGLRARGRDEVAPVLRDAQGPGKLRPGGVVETRAGDDWTEVFLTVTGPRDERVQLEVFSVGGDRAQVCLVDGWFEVEGQDSGRDPAQRIEPAADWSSVIPDAGARQVFLHLHQHGSLTETELGRILGGPRAARRFALQFDSYLTMLPFRVAVEPGPDGKRYVRQEQS